MKIVFFFTLLCFGIANAGNEAKGTFFDQQGQLLIAEATAQLYPYLQKINAKVFRGHEERRYIALLAIKDIQIRSTKVEYRDGKELMLNFNVETQKIIALNNFFVAFRSVPVSAENIKTVKRMLLHETAHLWGDSDVDAEFFAQSVLEKSVNSNDPEDSCYVRTYSTLLGHAYAVGVSGPSDG